MDEKDIVNLNLQLLSPYEQEQKIKEFDNHKPVSQQDLNIVLAKIYEQIQQGQQISIDYLDFLETPTLQYSQYMTKEIVELCLEKQQYDVIRKYFRHCIICSQTQVQIINIVLQYFIDQVEQNKFGQLQSQLIDYFCQMIQYMSTDQVTPQNFIQLFRLTLAQFKTYSINIQTSLTFLYIKMQDVAPLVFQQEMQTYREYQFIIDCYIELINQIENIDQQDIQEIYLLISSFGYYLQHLIQNDQTSNIGSYFPKEIIINKIRDLWCIKQLQQMLIYMQCPLVPAIVKSNQYQLATHYLDLVNQCLITYKQQFIVTLQHIIYIYIAFGIQPFLLIMDAQKLLNKIMKQSLIIREQIYQNDILSKNINKFKELLLTWSEYYITEQDQDLYRSKIEEIFTKA